MDRMMTAATDVANGHQKFEENGTVTRSAKKKTVRPAEAIAKASPPRGKNRSPRRIAAELSLSTAKMYQALITRDASLDGVFFAGIRTTGVFCRPGCGAKKPRRENCEFFPSAGEALRAGFRPCRRCQPLDPSNSQPPWIRAALQLADRTLDRRLTAGDLRACNLEPSRVARYFKRHFGMTFAAYHRARRVGSALASVRGGQTVLRGAMRHGFESEAGLRAAFSRLFGAPPSVAARGAVDVLHARWLSTQLGPLLAIAGESGVCLLEFVDRRGLESQINTLRRRVPGVVTPGSNAVLDQLAEQISEYFAGRRMSFDIPIVAPGTPFQQAVWDRLREIPPGQTLSYADVAAALGQPTAVRAVARANGMNRVALLIPCHRVVGSDGSPVGYAGGIWRKEWLLRHERGWRKAAALN
ncbi:MAG: methylated-DNA--[protein]-cysteine S-methyltransferase [Phycisphaerales bacterium]|nr:methylated-DNA--[protein]-cysteine S-methyltransferase [Phycisphaerales bacterium]